MRCYALKPDGQPCGSEEHLAKDCPHKNGSSTLVSDYRQDTYKCPCTEYLTSYKQPLFCITTSYDNQGPIVDSSGDEMPPLLSSDSEHENTRTPNIPVAHESTSEDESTSPVDNGEGQRFRIGNSEEIIIRRPEWPAFRLDPDHQEATIQPLEGNGLPHHVVA